MKLPIAKLRPLLWLPGLLMLLVFASLPRHALAGDSGRIHGTVRDASTGEGIADAVIVVQCTCWSGERRQQSSGRGVYSLDGLPPGVYTIQVLTASATRTWELRLSAGAQRELDLSLDLAAASKTIVVEAPMSRPGEVDAGRELRVEDARGIQFGDRLDQDAWSLTDADSSVTQNQGGEMRSGGNTAAENHYMLDGVSATDPVTHRAAVAIVRPFVERVGVRASGYDAEFGGAAGAQVSARRVSGSDRFRGEVGFRFTPRLGSPRFITGTDESLRVTQVRDFASSFWAVVSGPIIKERLHFTVGLSPRAERHTLYQEFRARVDADDSGGFEDCPFVNGSADCAPGTNYIQTQAFAQQRFKTGGVQTPYVLGLDWTVNPRHRLSMSVNGGPTVGRTTYRLPFAFDPTILGTNPETDPLGGSSRIATGVVNDHFGWRYRNGMLASLSYAGRTRGGNTEFDASLSFLRSRSNSAWRVDNPEIRNTPAVEYASSQGRSLYGYLDRDNALALVPGVDEACNRSELPGMACPIRVWRSGGLGEYGTDTTRRASAKLNVTHFLDAGRSGTHVVKYGNLLTWDSRSTHQQYSGANDPDFLHNCEADEVGGGEWCYSRADGYRIEQSPRVDNHRFVRVTEGQEFAMTVGYGRPRLEEGSLRPIANSTGAARVPAYEADLSTIQNALYLQDVWAPVNNLSLHYGVRWEMQDLRDMLGRSALRIWDNVAPRVGVSYDWTDEGKSRMYASYGRFYQPLPMQLGTRIFGGLVQVVRGFRQDDCTNVTTQTVDGHHARFVDGAPTQWCEDGGGMASASRTGFVVPRLKGQYNRQWQLGYEHEVFEDWLLGLRWVHTGLGRAVEDISVDSGSSYFLANPGVGVSADEQTANARRCERLAEELERVAAEDEDQVADLAYELDACWVRSEAYRQVNRLFAPPRRDYDALTLEVTKRYAKGWILLASYTYSKLRGNYDGFVDPTTGAINLGASLQYDTPEHVLNATGPLSYDQPHRLKLDASKSFKLGATSSITAGASLRVSSGYPVSLRASHRILPGPVYLLPRGSGGRIEPYHRLNLSVGWAQSLRNDLELELTLRALNVTNARTALRVDETYSFAPAHAIRDGDLSDLKHARTVPFGAPTRGSFFRRDIVPAQGNFGVQTSFQQPVSAQAELALRF